jgi:hypothetical protein
MGVLLQFTYPDAETSPGLGMLLAPRRLGSELADSRKLADFAGRAGVKRFCSPRRTSVVARFDARSALAKLILAVVIVASLVIGAAANGEATRGSALDDGGTADKVDARVIDLYSLEAKAKAVAATGRTVHDEAARMLDRLGRSGFPDEKLSAQAAIALKEASKLSYHLATASDVLADAIGSISGGKLAPSMALGQLLETFDVAKAAFDQLTAELLKQIRTVRSDEARRESIADEIARAADRILKTTLGQITISRLQILERQAIERERIQLQALIDSTRPANTAQKTLTTVISGLVPMLAPPITRQAPTPDIVLSVYGFFDHPGSEEAGYGLYTYVLLVAAPGTSQRNVAFLRELLASTRRSDSELAASRPQLNIFYVPAQNRIQALVIARTSVDAAPAIAAPGVYNYQLAESLLSRLCTEVATSNRRLCAGARRGPYLLTVPEPLSNIGTILSDHLFVDLSHIQEHAFKEFIRAIKEKIMHVDFTGRQKVGTLCLGLLNITLRAADWVNPFKEDITGIVFLSGDPAK